jgi:hypothetical protein
VLELRVSDLTQLGLTVKPDSLPGNPGHSLIIEIHEGVRGKPKTFALQNGLVEAVQKIHGRFVRNEQGEMVEDDYLAT